MKKVVNVTYNTINICGHIVKPKEDILLHDYQLTDAVKKRIKIFEQLNKIKVFNKPEKIEPILYKDPNSIPISLEKEETKKETSRKSTKSNRSKKLNSKE